MSEDTFFIGKWHLDQQNYGEQEKHDATLYFPILERFTLPTITFATYNHASSGPLKALGFRTGSKGRWVFLNMEIVQK